MLGCSVVVFYVVFVVWVWFGLCLCLELGARRVDASRGACPAEQKQSRAIHPPIHGVGLSLGFGVLVFGRSVFVVEYRVCCLGLAWVLVLFLSWARDASTRRAASWNNTIDQHHTLYHIWCWVGLGVWDLVLGLSDVVFVLCVGLGFGRARATT